MALYSHPGVIRAELPARLPVDLTDAGINDLIAQWSRYADGYVAAAYRVPLAEYPHTPGPVAVAVRLLVVHDIHVRYGLFRGEPNRTHTLWEQAHQILRAIQKGELVLVGGDGTGEEPIQGVATIPPLVSRSYRGRLSWEAQEARFGRLRLSELMGGEE